MINHICSSSRRVHACISVVQTTTNDNKLQQLKRCRRDVKLLRNMMRIFCIFIGGWGPICVVCFISYYTDVSFIIQRVLSLLAELTLFYAVVDLFSYNHSLRTFCKIAAVKCFVRLGIFQ